MLVNKLQFDTDKLKSGDVISVVSHNWEVVNNSYERKVLLTHVEPLKLEGVYFDRYNGVLHNTEISADEVACGLVSICEMIKVVEE